MTDQPSTTVVDGRYQLRESLGVGAMSAVYRAVDLETGQSVALKILREGPSDDSTRVRLMHEAVVMRQLRHRNILQIRGWGSSDGLIFLALEYVDSESLAAVLRRVGRVQPGTALHITREVALALEHAHQRHVIHGDSSRATSSLPGTAGYWCRTSGWRARRADSCRTRA